MSASKLSLTLARALVFLIASVTPCCLAQEWTKDPTTWWPDPSTGLMWSGAEQIYVLDGVELAPSE
jgi:hypothetical protein